MITLSDVRKIRLKPPKYTKAELIPHRQYFVTQEGLLYEYDMIGLEEVPKSGPSGKFIQVVKLPPVIADGFLVWRKKVYKVTKNDLLKGRINVSATNEVSIPGGSTTAADFSEDKHQLGSGDGSGSEVSSDADMAWENQVRALLDADDSEAWVAEEEGAA